MTVCTNDKEWLLGDVINGEMQLNDMGNVTLQCWKEIPKHFPNAVLDAFIVMPNHIHGIVIFNLGAKNISPFPPVSPVFRDDNSNRAKNISPLQHGTSMTIGSVIRGFKIGVTKWARANGTSHDPWQRNYYERIIRNEIELNKIREYIMSNPLNWETDENYNRS